MAISFDKAIAEFEGDSPLTSASFTPSASGETALLFGFDQAGGGTSVTVSGTGGAYTNNSYDAHDLGYLSAAYCVGVSSAAQTATVTVGGATADYAAGVGALYAGVGSVSASSTSVESPGTGAGAIAGTAITVPSGSYLIAVAWDAFENGGVTNDNGTLRYGGGSTGDYWAVLEIAGTGASVTPLFTDATNGATDSYIVSQFVLSPSGGSGIIDEDPEYVIFVNSIRQREKLGIKRGWRRDRRSRLILPSYSIERKAA